MLHFKKYVSTMLLVVDTINKGRSICPLCYSGSIHSLFALCKYWQIFFAIYFQLPFIVLWLCGFTLIEHRMSTLPWGFLKWGLQEIKFGFKCVFHLSIRIICSRVSFTNKTFEAISANFHPNRKWFEIFHYVLAQGMNRQKNHLTLLSL